MSHGLQCIQPAAPASDALVWLVQVYEVLRAVLHPVHLTKTASGAEQHRLEASPEGVACSCSTCMGALPRAEGLPGLACRVPLPESSVSASGVTEGASLPEGSHPQVRAKEHSG